MFLEGYCSTVLACVSWGEVEDKITQHISHFYSISPSFGFSTNWWLDKEETRPFYTPDRIFTEMDDSKKKKHWSLKIRVADSTTASPINVLHSRERIDTTVFFLPVLYKGVDYRYTYMYIPIYLLWFLEESLFTLSLSLSLSREIYQLSKLLNHLTLWKAF